MGWVMGWLMGWLADAQTLVPPECEDMCPCLASIREEGMNSFEKRRKEAVSRALVVKITWVLAHTIVLCSLSAADTALTWAWKLSRITYLVAFIFLVVTNVSFYLALCLANPGYLQKGVHALSRSSLNRNPQGLKQGSEDDLEAAELGIGGLAHIDVSGRRMANPHWQASETSPDQAAIAGPSASQSAEQENDKRNWHVEVSCANNEVSSGKSNMEETKEELESLLAGSDLIPRCIHKKNTVRTRGSSLGSSAEFSQMFQSTTDPVNRKGAGGSEAFAGEGDRRRSLEQSTSDPVILEDACSYHERRPSKPVSPICVSPTRRRHERPFSWWEGPDPGRWCEFCGAWQLLRSRHCHDCARCVKRFDHHCTWIGSCIGQDNHLLFWWYLVVQLTLLVWTLQICVGAFRLPVALTFGRTVVLLYCLIPTAVMSVFVGALLAYHTILVVSAQTTFELLCGHPSSAGQARVAYLKHLPRGATPFSQGFFQNVIDFCCARQTTTYQMPAVLSARRSVS